MRIISIFITTLILASLFIGLQARGQSPRSDEITAILRLIPRDAPAAIIVPNIKRLSDQVTQSLEGMDRANMLLGARPIDQFKAITGFSVGVNDTGGFAMALTEPVMHDATQPRVAFIVPVSDAQTFLDGNFTAGENNTHIAHSGQVLHAKILGAHVALAGDQATLDPLSTDRAIEQSLAAAINDDNRSTFTQGELAIVARGETLHHAIELLSAQAAKANAAVPIPPLGDVAIAREVELAIVSLDFDPLALIVRSFGSAKPETNLAKLTSNAPPTRAALNRLPNKPFHFAMTARFDALGDREALTRTLQSLNIDNLPAWLFEVKSMQMAAYPSPLGLTGGLLNDAALIFETSNPNDVKQSLRESLNSLKNVQGISREIKWEDRKAVKDAGVADAYDIRTVDVTGDHFIQQLIEQALVGRSNWRGFVSSTSDSVILTFSQRPAVLAAALQANSNQSLEQFGPIRTMRQWMPATSVFEIYIGVGQLAQIAKQAAAAAGAPDAGPAVDANLPPVGTSVSLGRHSISSTTVIPSGVLAMLFDQALAQAGRRDALGEDNEDTDPDADAP